MMNPVIYKDHTIEMSPVDNYHFRIKGPSFEETELTLHPSMALAKEAIDQRIELRQRQARVQHTLALKALNGAGEPVEIRGIHLSRSRLLGAEPIELPPTGPHTDTNVYPDVEWVRVALVRRKQVLQEAADIRRRLMRVEIKGERGYGKVRPEQYESMVEALTKEHTDKTARAQQMSEEL